LTRGCKDWGQTSGGFKGPTEIFEILKPTKPHLLVILTAPSGAGKTTIAQALAGEIPELSFSVSATTRAPRAGEVAGRDYYFMPAEEFEQKIEAGAFLEYEMVYAGKYYGTLSSELDRIWHAGQFPLRVVDVIGALDLKAKFGDRALSIFIQPPSIAVLEERLKERGTENHRTLEERITKAHTEMEFASRFDHVIVNDRLGHAVQQIAALVRRFIGAAQDQRSSV
jgi:guanylate kinase